ncbi:uncharacterized protein CANTADRAFT_338886 [Suhomyces tanzawaensis NRRL Y-17324]|uniref:Uncharacterized protein n=1 Tax=Suhomyces tanzawaensis NRRL Y-17324 TaxID=984487 RepID=A0A1E4SSB5_9ASCO|nr:uncharacterized protein CANTADRAFT_338886 [Suhomyces tanzawaensis NRRL Y-17324]ODV82391.1 hypothetical protein CANTADRAFT_338886 [Suhomyces tanzawaensis NRRL Y-17324]
MVCMACCENSVCVHYFAPNERAQIANICTTMPSSTNIPTGAKHIYGGTTAQTDAIASLEEVNQHVVVCGPRKPVVMPEYLLNDVKFKLELKELLLQYGISYDRYRFLPINSQFRFLYEHYGFRGDSRIYISEYDFLNYKLKSMQELHLEVGTKDRIKAMEQIFKGLLEGVLDFRLTLEQVMAWKTR